jgi:hypothetical protein
VVAVIGISCLRLSSCTTPNDLKILSVIYKNKIKSVMSKTLIIYLKCHNNLTRCVVILRI